MKFFFNVKNKKELFLMLAYVILACIFVYFIRPIYLISILIVLVPPAVYNFTLLRHSRKRVLIFSIVATLLFAFAIELSSRLANIWDVQSIFPRIFGLIPLENMLFAFLNFFWVLSFYEHFIDKDKVRKISKNFKYLVIIFLIFSITVFSLYFYNPKIISMNYITTAIIVLIIPSMVIFCLNPRLLKKTILPVIFFAVIFFIYEIVSLQIGSWWWPGEYLLPINLFGRIFPLDDILIWYFLSTISLIGGYEFFMDECK